MQMMKSERDRISDRNRQLEKQLREYQEITHCKGCRKVGVRSWLSICLCYTMALGCTLPVLHHGPRVHIACRSNELLDHAKT
jgi:hypothetical protein